MSTSAQHSMSYVKEDAFGQTPNNPALKALRHTGTNLAVTKTAKNSEELRADRQISDHRHGVSSVAGDIQIEFSYGSYDDFLEAVLCGTWAAKVAPVAGNVISASVVDNSINTTANNFPAVEPGDSVSIAGFTNAANNGVAFVVSRTPSKIVLSGKVLANEAAGQNVTLTTLTQTLKAGVTRRSFSVQRVFNDILAAGKPFHNFNGVEVNNFALNIPTDGMVTGSFSLIGKEMALSQTQFAGAAITAANSNRVFDSFSGTIEESGSPIAIVTELSLSVENGLEARHAIGSQFAISEGKIKESNVSGSASVYFNSADFLEKFLNETLCSMKVLLKDKTGKGYRIKLPAIIYDGGQPDTSGKDDIMISPPFQAILDPTTGTNIIIDRIPNA